MLASSAQLMSIVLKYEQLQNILFRSFTPIRVCVRVHTESQALISVCINQTLEQD